MGLANRSRPRMCWLQSVIIPIGDSEVRAFICDAVNYDAARESFSHKEWA